METCVRDRRQESRSRRKTEHPPRTDSNVDRLQEAAKHHSGSMSLLIVHRMPQASFILAAFFALQSSGTLSEAVSFRDRAIAQALASQSPRDLSVDAVNRTRVLVDEVVASSYPELQGSDI